MSSSPFADALSARALGALCALALAVPLATPAAAQTWPEKPITLIVPFPPGGPSDALARAVASQTATRLGTTIVVENVAGAAGSIGLQKLARAAPDGYTIGFGTIGTHAANMAMYRKPLYDARADFAPLAMVGSAPLLLVVRQDLPVKDFGQFVDYVAKNKASMTYASAGVGSIAHLACLLMLSDIAQEVTHVPYKGVAPAMTGLMGGETDFMCDQTTTLLAHLKGGRVRAIAALTKAPFPGLPDVAPAQASGRTAIDFRSWNGLFAPKGTPAAIVARLNGAINDALQDPALVSRMSEVGVQFPPRAANAPADLAALVDAEITRLVPVIAARNAYLD